MRPPLLAVPVRSFSLSVLAACLLLAGDAAAQTYTADARTVGMGGGGSNANIAMSMVPPAGPYAVIPIPLGLIQVLNNLRGFDPSNDKFDPAWAVEAAANPLHYTFGRKKSGGDSPEARFMQDLVNGRISRDLATYSSFHIPDTVDAEGLASPAFGGTIKFAKRSSGAFQGIFIGAGPYLSFGTDAAFDPRLTDILETGAHYPGSSLLVQDSSRIQLAMSVVVGYRARLELPQGRDRDGVYLAANYRYLHGFKYVQPDATIRFDTDNAGLLTVNPSTIPFVVGDLEADKGNGRAVDIGVQIVRNGWEGGFGVNGIGNRIDWSELTVKRYTLNSLLAGGDFVEQVISTNPDGELTVELPIVTSGNVGYDGDGYAFKASIVHGFNGNSIHGGGEKMVGPLALRAGARYSRDHWDPTWGFGIGRRVGLDVGFYGTHWNLEEKRQISMAVSIRIGRKG